MLSWILALAMALPVMVFLEPAVELFWLGLSFRAALVLGVLVAIGLILLLPALHWLREPNWWWAPLTALVLAAAFLGLGIRAARPTPQLPASLDAGMVLRPGHRRGAVDHPRSTARLRPARSDVGCRARAGAQLHRQPLPSTPSATGPAGRRPAPAQAP